MTPVTHVDLALLIRMVPVIRQQATVDMFLAPVAIAHAPMCGWPACHHRAQHHHPAGSVPASECALHFQFGAAYEPVRPYATAIIGIGAAGTWGAKAALSGDQPTERARGKAGALEGLRALASILLKR